MKVKVNNREVSGLAAIFIQLFVVVPILFVVYAFITVMFLVMALVALSVIALPFILVYQFITWVF